MVMSSWWLQNALIPNRHHDISNHYADLATIVSKGDELAHCSLMIPYGYIDLGQHWLRQWLGAWWHQANTWTNVDFSSVGFSGIHLRTYHEIWRYWSMKQLYEHENCISSASRSARNQRIKGQDSFHVILLHCIKPCHQCGADRCTVCYS